MKGKSAALNWAILRNTLFNIVTEMDKQTEENDHIISKEMYNNIVLKMFNDLNEFEAL